MDHEAVTGCLPASDFPQQGQPEVARVHVKSLSFHKVLWSQIRLSSGCSGRVFRLLVSAYSSSVSHGGNGYPFCTQKEENQGKCVLCF